MTAAEPSICAPGHLERAYLVDTAQDFLGAGLLAVLAVDGFVRQPCYSARARAWITMLVAEEGAPTRAAMRRLQGEFPDLMLMDVGAPEVATWPRHARWAIARAPVLWATPSFTRPLMTCDDALEAMGQALAQVGHIARHYVLTRAGLRSEVWSIRQLGWAVRYLDGVLSLVAGDPQAAAQWGKPARAAVAPADLSWLAELGAAWRPAQEAMFLDPAAYPAAALRVNQIVQDVTAVLADKTPRRPALASLSARDAFAAAPGADIARLRDDIVQAMGDNLRALYLQGSRARGDAQPGADIDTIVVLDVLDGRALMALRQALARTARASAFTLSMADWQVMPDFRASTLGHGALRLAGDVMLRPVLGGAPADEALRHHLVGLRAVSREHLISRDVGPRATLMLKLSMKLCRNAVLPLIASALGVPEDAPAAGALAALGAQAWGQDVAAYVSDVAARDREVVARLEVGDDGPLVAGFEALARFVDGVSRTLGAGASAP